MKKLISLCTTFMCTMTLSAATFTDGFIEYCPNFVRHTVSIESLDFSKVTQEVYTLPTSVKYEGEEYVVTKLGDKAIRNGKNNTICKKIIVPPTITECGKMCFLFCTNVIEIVISPQLKEISSSTFAQCHSLERILLPEGLETIGNDAFKGCRALKEITIPKSVKYIYGNAFQGTNIKEIILPEGMTKINGRAFCGMIKLQKIVIPASVTEIWDAAFSGCERLSEVVLPTNLTTISDGLFEGCSSLEHITIPEKVTEIKMNAFANCSELQSIIFPASVRKIQIDVLKGCYNLQTITFEGVIPPLTNYGSFTTNISKVYVPKSCSQIYSSSLPNYLSNLIVEMDKELTSPQMLQILEIRHNRISAPHDCSREESIIIQRYVELYSLLSAHTDSPKDLETLYRIQEFLITHNLEIKSLAKELKAAKTTEDITPIFMKYL